MIVRSFIPGPTASASYFKSYGFLLILLGMVFHFMPRFSIQHVAMRVRALPAEQKDVGQQQRTGSLVVEPSQ